MMTNQYPRYSMNIQWDEDDQIYRSRTLFRSKKHLTARKVPCILFTENNNIHKARNRKSI